MRNCSSEGGHLRKRSSSQAGIVEKVRRGNAEASDPEN